MMNRMLEGKIVVVTGGSRGIGRSIVLGAVAEGARVVFCARTLGTDSEAVVQEAEKLGGAGAAIAVTADVSREADVEAMFDLTIDRHERVDVLINNAGINRDALLVHHATDTFDEVIATNLTGAFLTSRRAISEFLSQGEGGRIVAIGSFSQNGATSQVAYAASKGGLIGLTRTIAKEYGHKKIAANVVAAGFVETALTERITEEGRKMLTDICPLRRSGQADEIAKVAIHLASSRASFINGEVVHASGGLWELYR